MLALVCFFSFICLGSQGVKLHRDLPPIPARVSDPDGNVVVDGKAIGRGQNVWQSIGGQEVGSIWGHGAYVAPDWSADWLHRESVFILDHWARAEGHPSWDAAPPEQKAALQSRLIALMRTSTHDAATGTLTLAPIRIEAYAANAEHYADVFSAGRDAYAIPKGALTDPTRLRRSRRLLLLDELGRLHGAAR
jgi:nitric oxide reductase subunit B